MTPSYSLDAADAHAKRADLARSVQVPDLLLLERARARDRSAVEALIRRYHQRLFRIARSVLLENDAAERVVEETYRLAFGNLEHYEPAGKFGAWLARLTLNHARAQQQSAPRVTRPGRGDATATDTLPATARSSDQLENASTREVLERAIDALPEVFRVVFVLRSVEGIGGIEAAACLGINETTVRTRLYRALRRLPQELAGLDRATVFQLPCGSSSAVVDRVLAGWEPSTP